MKDQRKRRIKLRDFALYATSCPICQTDGNAAELYGANFSREDLNPVVFSARRLPDRLHYRIVKCSSCGLVRADPVAAAELLAELYADSAFAYGDEVDGLKRTYGRYLDKLEKRQRRKESLLEIGCGNGFFLEQAMARGYAEVRGVEPSAAAVGRASAGVHPHIVCDLMRPGLFEADTFDVICLFQVFDHIADPLALLGECRRLLKPDGLMLFINHNVQAVSARLLKERSPIVDIEHTFLYDPETMSRLLEKCDFHIEETGRVLNTYSVYYLYHLLPVPAVLKSALLYILKASGLGRLQLRVPLGNLYVIAGLARRGDAAQL